MNFMPTSRSRICAAWRPRASTSCARWRPSSSKPVMLYSIGKDSSVMLHLALKAFYPGEPPFPLLHVDTTWKFREMIAFRDETAKRLGLDLIVHINQDGVARGINPFDHGSSLHTQVMKTEALKQALDAGRLRRRLRRRAPRRGEEPRQGAHLLASARRATAGTRRTSGRSSGALYNTRIKQGESDPRLPAVELDRARHLAIHPGREHPDRAALFRRRAAGGRARRPLIMVDDERMPLHARRERRR